MLMERQVLEDVDVTCRWWHVDVTSDWNVHQGSSPHWTHATARRPHKFVRANGANLHGCWGRWTLLRPRACLGASDDARPRGLVRKTSDFHGARCTSCHGTTYGKVSGDRGWNTGRKWPTSAVQHGIVVQLIFTGHEFGQHREHHQHEQKHARDGVGRQVREFWGLVLRRP